MIGPVLFGAPLALLALLALPLIWLLLRSLPPPLRQQPFPPLRLLQDAVGREMVAETTPLWLRLLRMIALTLAIIGFAAPIYGPKERLLDQSDAPLLILLDGSWASAADWEERVSRVRAVLDDAQAARRQVALMLLSDSPPTPLALRSADLWRQSIAEMAPNPWEPVHWDSEFEWVEALPERIDTVWISDGLHRDGRDDLAAALQQHGTVSVYQSAVGSLALKPPAFEAGQLTVPIAGTPAQQAREIMIDAIGFDPSGVETRLDRALARLEPGETESEAVFLLPPEIRRRLTRFRMTGLPSAAAVSFAGDRLTRRRAVLVSSQTDNEQKDLLVGGHYLRAALGPLTELTSAPLDDALAAQPDIVVLDDVASLPTVGAQALDGWIRDGGLLVRFAGRRMASGQIPEDQQDALLPVRLRYGGRSVGGTLSYAEPQVIRTFSSASPFFGLEIPEGLDIRAQLLPQPDANLADRALASLADGTPLVTARRSGKGSVVLFHVTADADWSDLPLTGLFVAMLERLVNQSDAVSRGVTEEDDDRVWRPVMTVAANGSLTPVADQGSAATVKLTSSVAVSGVPPGIYLSEDERRAIHAIDATRTLDIARWPDGVPVRDITTSLRLELKAPLLTAALALLLLDAIATLWLGGHLRRWPSAAASIMCILLGAEAGLAEDGVEATRETVLAYIVTGDPQTDRVSRTGLQSLSRILAERTTIEPAEPVGVDLASDEIGYFPFIYWPVTATQDRLGPELAARLNRYLRHGGMILFDTKDAGLGGMLVGAAHSDALRVISEAIDIPDLEPLTSGHVLSRSYYLLDTYPGRYAGPVWVETGRSDTDLLRLGLRVNSNDSVTPVVIGGNDWAAAWAMTESGSPIYPVEPGVAGARAREFAYRFGVNIVMHALTGNYKSDQQHIDVLIERLGL